MTHDEPQRLVREWLPSVGDLTREVVIDLPENLQAPHGKHLVVPGRITNRSRHPWPVAFGGRDMLQVGGELLAGPERTKIATARAAVPGSMLGPGESVEFALTFPTRKATPGPAVVVIDLLYEHVLWFHQRGGSLPLRQVRLEPLRFSAIDSGIRVDDPRFWQQHVPAYGAPTAIGIRTPSHQNYVMPTSRDDVHARSMLTMDEIALLYALARDHYRGEGKIVDLGPLLGVGTYAMARGLGQNRHVRDTRSAIYSYDLFRDENMMHFLPESDAGGMGSVFWRFLEINRDHLDTIVPVPGDFLAMRWIGAPIEVLFIDLAKTWSLNRHVLQHCFPHLIPGHSIVVQQDYVHVGEPWVALTMEFLDEYFERLYFIYGASAVYRLRKPIPSDLLATDLEALPLAEIDRLFERARAKAPGTVKEVLKCCQARVRMHKGELDGAEELIAQVDPAVRDDEVPAQEFSRAIASNLSAVSRWLGQERARGRR
jgi:hypothetical protein